MTAAHGQTVHPWRACSQFFSTDELHLLTGRYGRPTLTNGKRPIYYKASLSNTTSTTGKMSSENVSDHACVFQLCWNYTGTSVSAVRIQDWTFFIICSWRPHNCKTGHFTSWKERGRLYEMFRNEKCTRKACKTIVLYCHICKFVTFLLPSSSWLLKLPIYR